MEKKKKLNPSTFNRDRQTQTMCPYPRRKDLTLDGRKDEMEN